MKKPIFTFMGALLLTGSIFLSGAMADTTTKCTIYMDMPGHTGHIKGYVAADTSKMYRIIKLLNRAIKAKFPNLKRSRQHGFLAYTISQKPTGLSTKLIKLETEIMLIMGRICADRGCTENYHHPAC